MGGMTQVRLISSMAANEIYNVALEKLRVCAVVSAKVGSLTALGNRRVRRPPERTPSSRYLRHRSSFWQ